MVLNNASNNEQLPPVLLLSAGFGTRLRPITDSLPKPLIKVGSKTLIEWHLQHLATSGFHQVFINLHHLGQQIVDFVGDGSTWGLAVSYSWEEELLDTGGALKPLISKLKSNDLLIVNADSFFLDPADLSALVSQHRSSDAVATLLLREDPEAATFGSLGVSESGRICRFLQHSLPAGENPAESKLKEVMYCGVMIISKQVFALLPEAKISSITRDVLAPAVGRGEQLAGVLHSGRWFDVGTAQRLKLAEEALGKN